MFFVNDRSHLFPIHEEKINKLSDTKNVRPIVSFVNRPSLITFTVECITMLHLVTCSFIQHDRTQERRRNFLVLSLLACI